MPLSSPVEAPEQKPLLFYGWVVVALAFVTLCIVFGVWYSYSIFFLAVIEEFNWSRATASSIFSVFMICQSMTGLLTGYLQDRFGPKTVLPFGAVLLSVALILTGRAQTLWQFMLCYGLLSGAGVSLLGFASHSAFLPKWFERKRGLALGIATAGIGFGMLIIIPLIEKSITLFGWRSSYLYLGATVFCIVGPLNFFLIRNKPEDLNLKPDGDRTDRQRTSRLPAMTVKIIDQPWADTDWTLSRSVKTTRFWLVGTAFFFIAFVNQGVLLHAVSAMVDANVLRSTASYYFGLAGIMGSVGKILFGYLSDLYGREKTNALAGFISALGILCLIWVIYFYQGGFLLLMFALLFGLGYGATAPMLPAVCADIFMGKSFGLIFALICIGGGLGGSIGPFLCGFFRDINGNYVFSFLICLTALILSCFFICFSSPGKIRKMIREQPGSTLHQGGTAPFRD